jgi:hypothetical protein
MKSLIIGTLAFLLCIFSCSTMKNETLEFGEIYQHKLQYDSAGKVPVGISGLCGRSMFCVKGMNAESKDSTLTLFIEIGLCEKGESGSFSFPIHIDESVKRLSFGKQNHLLWNRDSLKE